MCPTNITSVTINDPKRRRTEDVSASQDHELSSVSFEDSNDPTFLSSAGLADQAR